MWARTWQFAGCPQGVQDFPSVFTVPVIVYMHYDSFGEIALRRSCITTGCSADIYAGKDQITSLMVKAYLGMDVLTDFPKDPVAADQRLLNYL